MINTGFEDPEPPPYSESGDKPSAPPPPPLNLYQQQYITPIQQQPIVPPEHSMLYSNRSVVNNSSVVLFDDKSIQCICQYCNNIQHTYIRKSYSLCAHVSCLGLCMVGCFFGCCLIPYCFDDLKITKHYCNRCNRLLGSTHIC